MRRPAAYSSAERGAFTLPASAPGSSAGPARRGDAEHAHRLQAEAELLAALGRRDVVAAELLDPLEAVADRVAVGEELFGGGGDVAVVVEIGLDGGDELGLVLLVVGGERRDRLRVEALELARVLADRRQQQAVGAGVLEGEQRAALGLADVDREPRLVARPVEVDRVGGAAAVADRQVEAGQAVDRARASRPTAARPSRSSSSAGTITATSARPPPLRRSPAPPRRASAAPAG